MREIRRVQQRSIETAPPAHGVAAATSNTKQSINQKATVRTAQDLGGVIEKLNRGVELLHHLHAAGQVGKTLGHRHAPCPARRPLNFQPRHVCVRWVRECV